MAKRAKGLFLSCISVEVYLEFVGAMVVALHAEGGFSRLVPLATAAAATVWRSGRFFVATVPLFTG